MFKIFRQNFAIELTDWLVNIYCGQDGPSVYFDRLRDDIKAGDVLLVEGRSRISPIIRAFTASRWTHCVLYIGRLSEIEDVETHPFADFGQSVSHSDTPPIAMSEIFSQ